MRKKGRKAAGPNQSSDQQKWNNKNQVKQYEVFPMCFQKLDRVADGLPKIPGPAQWV
jgi:hypothetical protein